MTAFAALDPVLASVPQGWNIAEFRRAFTLVESFRGKDTSCMILSLSSAGRVEARNGDGRQPPSADYLERYNRVRPGQLVVNPLWLVGGAIGVSGVSGCVSPEYRVYEPATSLHARYVHHLLRSQPYFDQYRLLVRAETTFDRRISKSDFHPLPLILPPIAAQQPIANFLDTETARIDALISKKRRLIDLLDARYRTLIDQALAGIDDMVSVRYIVSRLTSGPRGWSERMGDSGHPFFRITNISRSSIHLDRSDLLRVSDPGTAEALRTKVRAGDVLVSITADIGSVAVASPDDQGGFVSQHIALMTPVACEGEWLAYAIKGTRAQEELQAGQYGGTKTQLSLGDIAALKVPRPSLDEQHRRLMWLRRGHESIQSAQIALGRQIGLLHEHRHALITAAVTGEMEVPGVAG